MKSKVNSRLFIVAGPSQLLFLSAALLKDKELDSSSYNDFLLFTAKNADLNRKSIGLDIANKVWDWQSVKWIDTFSPQSASRLKTQFKNHYSHISSIWLCMPYGEIEIQMSLAFPMAKIVQFDDGLGSYVMPNTIAEYFRKPSFLKKKFGLYAKKLISALKKGEYGLPSWSNDSRYMLFSDYIDNRVHSAKSVVVDWSYLKIQLEKCQVEVNPGLTIKNNNRCLILGQYFSLFGYLNREDELEHYQQLCKKLQAEGYDIVWKEHPKNAKPFFKDLIREFPSIINLSDYYEDVIPVELVASNINANLFVASTSTSIVVLNKVFNFDVRCSAPLMENYMVGADKFVANLLINKLDDNQLLKRL